jgi:hypothetical protein
MKTPWLVLHVARYGRWRFFLLQTISAKLPKRMSPALKVYAQKAMVAALD